MNVFQQVITYTLFLPIIFGGGGSMKTIALYGNDTIASVEYIMERTEWEWDQPDVGMNQYVYGLAYDNVGNLYAAGAFTLAGGNTVNYAGLWNGADWSDLDGGLSAYSRAVAIAPDGAAYFGGNFVTAGTAGSTVNYVAKWNGASWDALGSGTVGVNGLVYALTVGLDGALYAGGAFTTAGGGTVNYIAKFDGSDWSDLDGGMNGNVYALTIGLDGSLYAGGAFTTAGGSTVNYVAKWDGSAWSDLDDGMNASVNALAFGPNGIMYAGGSFTQASGGTVPYIAKWNGANWSGLGDGMNGLVDALVFNYDDNLLYAGGIFTEAGDLTTTDRIAAWNGSVWQHLNLELYGTPTILCLAHHRSKLAFGFGAAATGDAVVWGTGAATVDNEGTADAYPRFSIKRTGGTSAKLQSIVNATTGDQLLFDWDLLDGEEIIIDLRPDRKTITSSFSGNAISKLLPNSNLSTFKLVPGENAIRLFITEVGSPTLTAFIQWTDRYLSAGG